MRPTEQTGISYSARGKAQRAKIYSFVATLCEIGGDEVKAIRYDGCKTWVDAFAQAVDDMPGWKVKSVERLFDDDFEEGY